MKQGINVYYSWFLLFLTINEQNNCDTQVIVKWNIFSAFDPYRPDATFR